MRWKTVIDDMDLSELKLRRINTCIKVQQRVVDNNRNFDMTAWQDIEDHPTWAHKTEKDLHTCGSAACFGGYLALSPEWKRAGGSVDMEGTPVYEEKVQQEAVQAFLGLSQYVSQDRSLGYQLVAPYGNLYGLQFSDRLEDVDITAKDVLTRLKYAREVAVKQRA